MTCEEVEIALASDRRAARQDATIRVHLEGCAACREALRAFEWLETALEAARREGPSGREEILRGLDERIDRETAGRRTARWPFRLAAAAAIAVAALLHVRARHDAPTSAPASRPRPTEARIVTTAELCARLRSADASTRIEALNELARRPDAVSRSLLVASLQDPELAGRAAEIAGGARLREAIPSLSRLAKDPSRGHVAVVALAAIGGREAAGILLRQAVAGPHAAAALDGLRGIGPVAVDVLAESIQRARESDREGLLAVVVSLRATRCLSWVVSLAERSGPLQENAIEALGALGDARATGALARIAKDSPLRPAVLSSLRALGEEGTRELARRAGAGRREERGRAIELLGDIGGPSAVKALIAALGDPSVRADAARALGRTGDASAAPALAACLHDPAARPAAIEALERVADASSVPLLTRVARDPSLRRDALRILGRTGATEALPSLVHALGVRETAAVAVEGLVAIGDPAVPALIRALQARDTAARARDALSAIALVDLGADPRAWRRWWQERQRASKSLVSSGVGHATEGAGS